MIGKKLKELRIKKGFTIVQLCERIKMNPNTYAKYERDERDVSTEILCKIADFYDVTTDYLLSRESTNELPDPITQLSDIEMEQKFLKSYFELISPQLRAKVWEQLAVDLHTQMATQSDDGYIIKQTTVGAELDCREVEKEKELADAKAKNAAAG